MSVYKPASVELARRLFKVSDPNKFPFLDLAGFSATIYPNSRVSKKFAEKFHFLSPIVIGHKSESY